ncbi:hypothetical protein BD626DRAFT_625623 [Schizophyllum amplum]|uniref:Uncharacterized protein n=1 Tax=Schizophyllum amplum TaxID=97359 RepID=A0A550D084_9AGAR|nr:hypothetical protein BD626DRAFT_625623 [Auriculariopsis ampla]
MSDQQVLSSDATAPPAGPAVGIITSPSASVREGRQHDGRRRGRRSPVRRFFSGLVHGIARLLNSESSVEFSTPPPAYSAGPHPVLEDSHFNDPVLAELQHHSAVLEHELQHHSTMLEQIADLLSRRSSADAHADNVQVSSEVTHVRQPSPGDNSPHEGTSVGRTSQSANDSQSHSNLNTGHMTEALTTTGIPSASAPIDNSRATRQPLPPSSEATTSHTAAAGPDSASRSTVPMPARAQTPSEGTPMSQLPILRSRSPMPGDASLQQLHNLLNIGQGQASRQVEHPRNDQPAHDVRSPSLRNDMPLVPVDHNLPSSVSHPASQSSPDHSTIIGETQRGRAPGEAGRFVEGPATVTSPSTDEAEHTFMRVRHFLDDNGPYPGRTLTVDVRAKSQIGRHRGYLPFDEGLAELAQICVQHAPGWTRLRLDLRACIVKGGYRGRRDALLCVLEHVKQHLHHFLSVSLRGLEEMCMLHINDPATSTFPIYFSNLQHLSLKGRFQLWRLFVFPLGCIRQLDMLFPVHEADVERILSQCGSLEVLVVRDILTDSHKAIGASRMENVPRYPSIMHITATDVDVPFRFLACIPRTVKVRFGVKVKAYTEVEALFKDRDAWSFYTFSQ